MTTKCRARCATCTRNSRWSSPRPYGPHDHPDATTFGKGWFFVGNSYECPTCSRALGRGETLTRHYGAAVEWTAGAERPPIEQDDFTTSMWGLVERAEGLGLRVAFRDLGRRHGEVRASGLVLINPYRTQVRQRVTLAHEMGHWVHGHDWTRPHDVERDEREADRYAARLLISPAEYAAAERLVGPHLGALAAELGVTRRLVELRRADLMPLLGYDKWERFAGAVERAEASAANQGRDGTASRLREAVGTTMREDFHLTRFAAYLVDRVGAVRIAGSSISNSDGTLLVTVEPRERGVRKSMPLGLMSGPPFRCTSCGRLYGVALSICPAPGCLGAVVPYEPERSR